MQHCLATRGPSKPLDTPLGSRIAAVDASRNRAIGRPTAPARVSCSRNSQTALASGTRSTRASPTKRMKESRTFSWVFGLGGRPGVERLQHQELEYQDGIVGWPAALGPGRALERRLQVGPEQLEVITIQSLERIPRSLVFF